MAARIIIKNLKRDIFTQKSSRNAVIRAAEKRIESQIELAKVAMLGELNKHKFTEEIRAGVNSENTSGSLGGRGNLFSFIGFDAGTRPIEDLENIIIQGLGFSTDRRVYKDRTRHKIFLPNREVIFAATPMPWENGRSWVRGLESGISGYSNYLYFLHLEQEDIIRLRSASRSGGAIQSKTRRTTLYVPRFQNEPYLSLFTRAFERTVKKIR